MLASVPWDLGGGGEGQSQQQFSKSFNEIFRENIVKTLNLFVLLMSSDFCCCCSTFTNTPEVKGSVSS